VIYSSTIFGDSDMITEDEEFKFDDQSIDYRQSTPPSWQEIEDLLDFAEELKKKYDNISNRIYFLNITFVVLNIAFVTVGIVHMNSTRNYNTFSTNDSTFILYTYLIVFIVLLQSYVMFRNKMQRKRKLESRALDSVIRFLRENNSFLTKNFSELQKIHLKIKLSRFDI
jgi:hypothetical protein